MPQIPEYTSRVIKSIVRAGDGRMSTPRPENFENGAASMAQFGRAAAQEGARWAQGIRQQEERQSAKRRADILLSFEKENSALLNGTVDEKGNVIEPGLLTTQLENAKGSAKIYLEKGNALIDTHLSMAKTKSERDYLERALSRSYQNSYDTMVKHELNQTRASTANSTKAYFDTAAGQAGSITTPQQMREHLDDLYTISDEEARANGLTPDEIKNTHYVLANQNYTSSIKGALTSGNYQTARKILDSGKKELLADDYNKLNYIIKKAEEVEARINKSDAHNQSEQAKNTLYETAIRDYEQDPQALIKELQIAKRNPFAFQQTLAEKGINITAKDLASFIDWADKLVDDPNGRAGELKQQNYQLWTNKYNDFKIDEKKLKIKNKDMNNPGNLVAAINATRASIEAGDFTVSDAKKAQEKINIMRQVLGNMEITPSSVGSETVGGSTVRLIQTLTKGGSEYIAPEENNPNYTPSGILIKGNVPTRVDINPILLPEEKSLLIEDAFARLQEMGINLETKDLAEKEKARAVMQLVVRQYLHNKFIPDYDDVMAIQYGKNIIQSYAVKPNPNLGAHLTANYDQYRLEELNGVKKLVRRNEAGKIIHEQLY